MTRTGSGNIVALCGGVGGARMAAGLQSVLEPGRLRCIVNVGDDFTHLGFPICPDVDTVLYTLAGLENPEAGWGRRDESWHFMETIRMLGGPAWFLLGDRDLALHAFRRQALDAGKSLTEVTREIAAVFGVRASILPATDEPAQTICRTDEGTMSFQDYFVRRRCEPALLSVDLSAASKAHPTGEVREALRDPELGAIVICPSNPYLSIDPIFAMPGMRELVTAANCPKIAVSPVIGRKVVKGPLAKIMAERGLPVSAATIAQHYRGIIDHFLIAPEDAGFGVDGIAIHTDNILMKTPNDRARLARRMLDVASIAVA